MTRGAGVARTIRFPVGLRATIVADADRCGRSFEAHVIALLRRHYGEDVDIAPPPDAIMNGLRASVAGISNADEVRFWGRDEDGGR